MALGRHHPSIKPVAARAVAPMNLTDFVDSVAPSNLSPWTSWMWLQILALIDEEKAPLMENKIIQKAIAIKKRAIKKRAILDDEIPEDDTPR